MTISALEAVSALTSGASVAPTGYVPGTDSIDPSRAASSSGAFGNVLTGAVNNLQGLQNTSNELAVKAVTGDLDDIHDYTIAATEAKVTLELTAAIRNKAVDAFTEIMRMQA
ncbi:flagellar hook-basal body complex protein FliE [Sanguibacter gelidistatuariae]|uniref:Flagellar hook-basal body complex protein FliE n=1 Tax=Sanguibacter gelidistatuariae TaxID=1814289 RepID=A0A1G6PWT9_9MICO|nr:flagellar hook-basal body complex protein FliE [Sanguibacter gelidistatuariae]SDC84441.1 flagellar hook-basal body complex protein FliE [Sanguibacter gelidistatuariae]